MTETNADYVAHVAALLGELRLADRKAALADLESLLAEGVDPSDLGDPADYAAALLDDAEPGPSTFLGIPVNLRGFSDAAARAQVWDPTDPRILVPHVAGIGWAINIGAVAVKLGWLRPDDYDADVLAAIPAPVLKATRAVPPALAAVTAVASVAAASTGPRVPAGWTLAGKVDRWAPAAVALLPLVGSASALGWWGSRPATGDDRLVRPAIAGALNTAFAGTACLAARSARKPSTVHPSYTALPLAVLAVQAVLTLGPVRAGLNALWARSRKDQP